MASSAWVRPCLAASTMFFSRSRRGSSCTKKHGFHAHAPQGGDSQSGGRRVDDGVGKAGARTALLPRAVQPDAAGEHRGGRQRFVVRHQAAAIEQQIFELHAVPRAQHTADFEQQGLRAAGEGIVAHQQQASIGLHLAAGKPRHGAAGGVEIGGAEMNVGFEIGALAPLVPGVHADDRLVEKRGGLRLLDDGSEPGFVFGGGGAGDHQAGALAPRVVVPSWAPRS